MLHPHMQVLTAHGFIPVAQLHHHRVANIDPNSGHLIGYSLCTSEQFRLPRQVTPSRLTDIEYIDPDTDQLAWVSWLSARIQDAPNMTVMHMCDVHEPFSDPQAVDLFMIVAEQAQPDVIVVGSDFADMYLKTCETSKAEHRRK